MVADDVSEERRMEAPGGIMSVASALRVMLLMISFKSYRGRGKLARNVCAV